MANKEYISDELLAAYLDGNTNEEDTRQVLEAMKHDKKVRSGELRFVLVDDIASWRVETLSDDLVLAALGG